MPKPPKLPVDWKAEPQKVEDLFLDPKNPRLRDFGLDERSSQSEIVVCLWKHMAVDELVLSIKENGFYRHEALLAVKENNKLYVIEGNRRLAAVKLLTDEKMRDAADATDIPKLSSAEKHLLRTLPVIVCQREDPQIWGFLGFKHINGAHAWESYPKAAYIAWLHNELGTPLREIADRLGDKHNTVVRHYDAFMVFEQAEREKIFNRENRYKDHFSFSHLFTGLGLRGIRKFLGLPAERNDVGSRNPIQRSHLKELKDLLLWMYGDKDDDIRPVVQTQNPDLRRLDEVLQNKNGVAALRKGLPLAVCLDLTKGDERLFRESLVEAKQNLQRARGTVITGYEGSKDLLSLGEEIVSLASAILDDMISKSPKATSRKRARS